MNPETVKLLPSSKKILVTGGAGFIGSNIVDYLVNAGHKNVVVLDNLATGDLRNIQAHLDGGRIEFLRKDIRRYEDCLEATRDCEIVLHQAALGSVPRSIESPMDTHETNVNGFMNMLEASRKNGVKRFIYASSSSVYGDDLSLPKMEERTGNPLSPYAVSKKTNELYARVFAELYKMQIIGLRYFNVFGPKQNPKGPYAAVIPIFASRLINGEVCTIFGDGNNRRDFTFVSNVVQANIRAAVTENQSAFNQVYNIGFGATKTINELYQIICGHLGSALEPAYMAPRPGETRDSFADISKAREKLGYVPEISLESGIKVTIGWYKEHI